MANRLSYFWPVLQEGLQVSFTEQYGVARRVTCSYREVLGFDDGFGDQDPLESFSGRC